MADSRIEEIKRRVSRKRSGKSSKEEIIERVSKKRYSEDVSKVDDAYVKSFFDDAGSFFTDSQKELEGMTWESANSYAVRDRQYGKSQDLGYRANLINYYLENNKDRLDSDSYASLSKALSDYQSGFSQVGDAFTEARKYYSQWDSEDDYKVWEANQKQYDADKNFDVAAGEQALEALKAEREAYFADQDEKQKQAQEDETFWESLGRWLGTTPDTTIPLAGASGGTVSNPSSEYDKKITELEEQIKRAKYVQGYEGFMSNKDADDYAANSQYVSTRTDVSKDDARWGLGGVYYDESKLFGDYMYDYINKHQDALDVSMVNDTQTNAYFLGLDDGFLQTMTEDEIGVYNYLYKTQGKESADAFLTYIGSDLQGRRRAQENAKWAAYAQEDPFGSSVFSTLISPLKGLSYLGQVADMLDDGAMEENAGYNRFSEIPSTIRSQVSTTIENSGKWGKVGSFAYNTGMSMADFLFTTAVSGGNQALSLAIMGSGAAADATIAAKNRGLEDGQAFTLGTIAGLAEVAMEKISLGAWLEGDMSEGALRYVLKNALSEGGEEASTSVVNLLADIIIAGDKSEWNVAMQAYIDQGKTEAEAFGLVLAENAAQIGLDALGGALSGTAIGGGTYTGTSTVAGIQHSNIAKDKTATQNLVSESLELNPGSQYAQRMKSKLDKGKNLTGMQIRNLLAANQEQITTNDMKLIQQAAEQRLTTLGQTKDVSKIAELAAKYATGGELTRSEKNFLASSQYGSRVANELMPQNIESGDYSTEWAEGIGTKSVNAVHYNIKSILAEMTKVEDPATYKSITERVGEEGRYGVAESGETTVRNEDGAVTIAEVSKIEDGQMTVKLDDGREVYAGDIDFASEDESQLYSAVADMENMTPAAATALVHAYDSASGQSVTDYVNGIDEAYTYGYYGYSEADLNAGNFTSNLTSEQMMNAYRLGQSAKKIGIESKNAQVVKMRTAAEAKADAKNATVAKKALSGSDAEVYFMDSKTVKKFDASGKYDDKRMAGVNYAKFLSKLGIGSKYYFYESYIKDGQRVFKDANGNEVNAPNGFYKTDDGSIYIDLNAGDRGDGFTLYTLGHELTHFIKQWSEAKFQVLADFLIEEYGKTDMSMHQRVLEKQSQLEKTRGEKVSYDEAFEEVVADAMSTMLSDGNLHEKLAKLKAQDKGLFNKIKKFFEQLVAKFKKVYAELTPDQKDAQDVQQMKEAFDRIQTAFAEALVEASDNFHAAMESVVEANAEPVGADEIITEGAVVTDGEGVRHSIRSMKHDIADGKMFRDLMDVCGWTQAQVGTLRTQLKDLVEYMVPYRNILDMNENYGAEGRRFSPYKPNSDPLYKISMDFSTLCSKRLLTQYVIEQLQLRENRPMSAEEQMAIRDMLNEYRKLEKGLQVACSMCYVEAARLKAPKQIQRWLNNPAPLLTDYFGKKNKAFNDAVKKAQADFKESKGYDREAPKKDMKQADVKELNKIGPKMRSQYQPSAEEQAIIDRAKTLPNSTYLTAGNLADLSETDPVIYDAYTAFVRTATRSKSLEKDEPYYYGDSTRDNGNGIVVTDSFIEAVNRENGMRFSSWSDWRIQHLLDYITAVIDNSVRGAAMHGYTKFGDEVRVLGKTGMMFNMSGVTGTQTGLNEDGSLNFSETESIDVNEAIQLREEFPDTAGLQCIGVSDQHIVALLRSDIIDYVIPYHVSGLNADLRRMAKIYGWDDYTGTQHAAIDKSIKLENAVDKEHWHEEPVFSEFFVGYDTGMTGIEAMRASAEKYKQMCKDRGLTPKFNQFATEENYWKLLIDRKMINQQTGKLIRQKAVTPTFDFGTIKGVVDKFVDNYDAGLEARALNHIVENWDTLPQRIKDLKKQGGTKAKKTKKAATTLANQTVAAQPKNSDRSNGFQEHDVVSAVYTIRNEKAKRGHDLVKIGTMPTLYRDLFHLDGDVYVSNEHLYQNMVSRATAEAEGRYDEKASADYHELGEGKIISAIEQFQDPLVIMESLKDYKEPRLVAILEEKGNDGQNLMAIMELYAQATYPGASQRRNHVLITIYEKNSLPDYIEKTVDKGRILYKKEGLRQMRQAGLQLAGETSEETLKKNVARFNKKVKDFKAENKIFYSDRYNKIASDFTSHMQNIVKTNRGWYAEDVFKYVEEHPELGFIELIYAKDKDAKKLLEKFLGGIDDVKVLDQLSWFMGEAYGDKDRTWSWSGGAQYPYRGAVRTFRNAIKKRINAIMSENVGGTNLGIKNGEVELADIKELYNKLNSNEEIGRFAEKVFATADKLGVNIRFTNQTMAKNVAGDALGDMVEYKTSYFNDTAVSDQRKANTLLHELIHACTVYVMQHNPTAGDVHYSGIFSENWNNISNAATRLNRIYSEIERDPDFKGQYGITNAKEMVAELANEEFVGLLKKKNLWDRIVDWICELFGYRRGNSAYENARMCVDYILDNPEIDVYKNQSAIERRNAKYNGYDVFGQTRYSERNNAPTFYSQMGKVVEGMKQEKFGASSVISMLRGRGVKAEEIRWSGIQAWLDGKKSVTKAELLEFIKGSMLHIEEQELGSTGKPELWDDFYRQMEDVIPYFHQEEIEEMCFDYDGEFSTAKFETELREYVEDGTISEDDFEEAMEYAEEMGQYLKNKSGTQWSQYKLDGGSNYREMVFKMPGSTFSTSAMRTHWGNDANGILAHVRMQDFEVGGKQMLFIEEIQSDWHNAGHKHGYMDGTSAAQYEELKDRVDIARSAVADAYTEYSRIEGELSDLIINFRSKDDAAIEKWNRDVDAAKERTEKARLAHVQARHEYAELSAELQKLGGKVPDAPFKDNYHEFVLKRLIRMAAEEGYDSIGWTTADIQSDRWSDEFAEGYRIEYDQDIPKFLKKYGKQWGAEVGKTTLPEKTIDLDNLSDEWLLDESELPDGIRDISADQFVDDYENGTVIWSMDITPAMKKSVLKEGQALYSERTGDSVSNRSLLANAFEGITMNSNEYKLIQEYKSHVAELNSLEEKLSDFNREIRKIRFTEGEYDAEKLRRLEDEANKIAKAINQHDKKLLSLEASEPLRRVIDRERKKAKQKTMDHVKEIQQNKKNRAEQTELRQKIRKKVRDLNKLLNRGNKKLNVKEDMKGFVSKALELADYLFTDHISNDELIRKGIDEDLVTASGKAKLVHETEDILSKLYDHADSLTDEEFTRLDAKRKANEDKLRDLLTAQRNRRLQTPVYDLFSDLVTEYSAFKNSSQDAVKAAYNPEVERFLRTYVGDEDSDRAKALKNMRVADMTTEELWKLDNAYQMVLHAVRTANKLFVNGNNTSIEQMVTEIVMDFGSRQIPEKKMAIAIQKLGNKIGWNYEKLYYALDRIGSKTFTDLIMNLANSENIVMQDVMEAAAFRDEIVEKYGFNNWDVNKEIDREFLDHTGKKFKMTLGQLMSLYAYSRREGAWDHIEYGGFVFGEAALTNPKPADSFKLSKEQCEAITGTLTKEQKGYVEDMQKFLSETMGEKGNEVSMMLYGIKMFGEKNYFPIHIAGQFKAQAQESQAKAAAGFGSMSNAGFTHAQNPNAKAPFVLEGFNDVWSDHVNEMSRYHGTVPALEDLRRVMNRSSYSENTAESTSVKVIMENHFGKEAVEYFDNLYREANSGAITDKLQQKSKKLLSLFRKNSVAYSLSVLVQQPASLVRAYAMIDRKYFGFKGVGAISSGVYKAVSSKWNKAYENAYNEMLKYAPGVTMTKEIGGFDTSTGGSIRSYLLDTGKSFKQKWKTGTAKEKGQAVMDLVDDNPIANLPNVADKIAWIEIWNACKRETLAKHKDLAPTSDEFMKIVGDRFTEVIRATQVYDSIFAKSPMLKSKNLAVQMLVSFMNEPNTVANMAESALRDFTKGNRMEGLKKAHVLVHSIIFTGVLKSLIYAMRDDDEDETYIEKYIEALTGSLMDDFNPLNYIPFARDVWSVAQGYDVERTDMAIVSDAIGALNNLLKAANTDKEDMTEDELIELDKKITKASWDLVDALAAFTGIPMKNIRREINAVIDHAKIASANAGKTTAMSTWDTISDAVIDSIPFMGGKSKTDKLYAAIIEGDTEYIERMKATYKTEDSYHNAVRKALRENDPRIKEAAQAHIDGDPSKRVSIAKQIIADGFILDDVVSAINSEINAMTTSGSDSGAKKEKGVYTAADIAIEAANGDWASVRAIKDDIIQTAQKNGKTKDDAEDAFASSVQSEAKEAYLAGSLNDTAAKKLLVEYAGKDEDDATETVRYWSFCKKYPAYSDFSKATVGDYYEFAEPANIPLDVYAQYVSGTANLSTIYDEWGDELMSKREQVLDVIDSLPLTWQQKDALYLAAGYAESKIWDVPW